MQTEFVRTAGKSYMVKKAELPVSDGFEMKMILAGKPAALVPMEIIENGDETQLWYDVTGSQALSRQMEISPLKFMEIKNLLYSICDLKNGLFEYLLTGSGISMSPEMIFVDRARGNMRFCYVPGEDAESAADLMREVIKHLDHTDTAGVRLGYYVFDICREGELTEEICRMCIETANSEGEVYADDKYADNTEAAAVAAEQRREKEQRSVRRKKKEKRRKPEKKPGESKPAGYVSKLAQLKSVITERLGSIRGRLLKKGVPAAASVRGFGRKEKANNRAPKKRPERTRPDSDTCLLPVLGAVPVWELSYIGGGTGRSFRIESFPFILGKDRQRANGVLEAATVSRVHASIELEGGMLFLTDNNSTNGTYLNGRLIPMNTKMSLREGDMIVMGTEEFRLVRHVGNRKPAGAA